MKAFRAYVESIFLYNYEIWTITPSQAVKTIDTFQRRLLRTYAVCNFQSMKNPVELNSLLSKFLCYITWFAKSPD